MENTIGGFVIMKPQHTFRLEKGPHRLFVRCGQMRKLGVRRTQCRSDNMSIAQFACDICRKQDAAGKVLEGYDFA